jgi:hypothetical protein
MLCSLHLRDCSFFAFAEHSGNRPLGQVSRQRLRGTADLVDRLAVRSGPKTAATASDAPYIDVALTWMVLSQEGAMHLLRSHACKYGRVSEGCFTGHPDRTGGRRIGRPSSPGQTRENEFSGLLIASRRLFVAASAEESGSLDRCSSRITFRR